MTQQSKHTPAPWYVSQSHPDIRITGIENNSSNWNATIHALYCQDEVPIEEHNANASLIAAAPELLEALELADAALSGSNMNMNVVQKKVKAAIAKARG